MPLWILCVHQIQVYLEVVFLLLELLNSWIQRACAVFILLRFPFYILQVILFTEEYY